MTQKQFDLAEAIEEIVFVETPLDTDGDGRRDRVRIRISRPLETRTQGIDVPVVFEHSPYRGPFGNAQNHDVDVDRLPQDAERARAPTSPAGWTTTTSRAATRSSWGRASAPSTRTAAPTSAARRRRPAPRP